VHLDAPSALKIKERFKNATPVTSRAFRAIFQYFARFSIFVECGGGASDIMDAVK
jgi:hypothetical protein